MTSARFRAAFLRIITRGPAAGGQGVAVAVVLIAAIGAIGAIDYASGSGITFGAVYLVPVVAAGVWCTTLQATVVAAAAAVVWSGAGALLTDEQLWGVNFPTNSILRFFILGLIVVLLSALRDALLEARRSEQRSQDFLAFAAHQLRTPTAAASTAAQTLLARGGSPEDEELLVRIAHETTRAGRLVGSVLQYLRMHHHRGVTRTAVDLDAVCREALDRSRDAAAVVTVEAFVGGSQRPVVEANADALIEAVCCLLDNARRHARSTVHVRTAVADGNARLIVADDGPGLPAGHDEQAFEPFVSIDGHGGTGLGLAIARGLVEGQGGTLAYDDGDFVVQLPLGRAL